MDITAVNADCLHDAMELVVPHAQQLLQTYRTATTTHHPPPPYTKKSGSIPPSKNRREEKAGLKGTDQDHSIP